MPGLEHRVAVLAKHLAGQRANAVIVLDEQNRLGPSAGHHSRIRRQGVGRLRHSREIDLERRPLPRLAVHPDMAIALLHDAVHGGETEAGALARFLGGEERLEDVGLDLDRKSTRLNSSHITTSYAVFCSK